MTDNPGASLWERWRGQSVGAWVLLAVVVAVLVAFGVLLLGPRPNPTRGVRALIQHLEASDEEAFARMSERYRAGHSLTEFQRAIGRLNELRSAEGARSAPRIPWTERPTEVAFCTELYPELPGQVRVVVVWEEGRWAVDRLAIDERQLDDAHPAEVRCGVTR